MMRSSIFLKRGFKVSQNREVSLVGNKQALTSLLATGTKRSRLKQKKAS